MRPRAGLALWPLLVAAAAATTLRPGGWAGPHVALEATAKGARIEYDCGHGTIDGPLRLRPDGTFAWKGRHVREGGPEREDAEGEGARARYGGRLKGETLELTVTLSATGQSLGTFTLTRGAPARLRKCL